MTDSLTLFGWNQLIAVAMATVVWVLCRTPIVARRPAVCHGLWLLVLVKLVTPPLIPVPVLPAVPANEPAVFAPALAEVSSRGCEATILPAANNDVATKSAAADVFSLIRSGAPGQTVSDYSPPATDPIDNPQSLTHRIAGFALMGVSLVLTAALWMLAGRQCVQMRRLTRREPVKSGRAVNLLHEVSKQFNLRSAVGLQIVDAPVSPMLCTGLRSATIVLPRNLVESLDDGDLCSILAHELGHHVRRDHWVKLFALAVTTLYWWNPVAWLARRELAFAAEACCDAVALDRLAGSRKSYAQTLLAVVDSLPIAATRQPALAIRFGHSHSLRRRFELIADKRVTPRFTPGGWILLAFGLACLTIVPARAEPTPVAVEPNAFSVYCCPTSSSASESTTTDHAGDKAMIQTTRGKN